MLNTNIIVRSSDDELDGFIRFVISYKGSPCVSVWSRGKIGFNRAAYYEFKLELYNYVVFFLNKEKKKLGIYLTNNNEELGRHKIADRPRDVVIFAPSFLRYARIKPGKYEVQYDEKANLLMADIEFDI